MPPYSVPEVVQVYYNMGKARIPEAIPELTKHGIMKLGLFAALPYSGLMNE